MAKEIAGKAWERESSRNNFLKSFFWVGGQGVSERIRWRRRGTKGRERWSSFVSAFQFLPSSAISFPAGPITAFQQRRDSATGAEGAGIWKWSERERFPLSLFLFPFTSLERERERDKGERERQGGEREGRALFFIYFPVLPRFTPPSTYKA
jgi:hypothetical protein